MQPPKEFFCSLAARQNIDSLFATASHYAAFIMVRYNWPFPEKIADADLPKDFFKNLQQYARANKAKLLLFRSDEDLPCQEIVFVDHYNIRYREFLLTPGDLIHFDLKTFMDNSISAWQTEPFYLVCTNGKKDKCCALKGFPVYEQLKTMSPRVFQCSHVGGDRFAANLLLMPFGIYYGWVEVEDIDPIMESTAKEEIYFNAYRGRATMNFRRQTAEYFLRKATNDFSIASKIQFLKEISSAQQITISGIFNNAEFTIRLRAYENPNRNFLTCKSSEKEAPLRYALEDIEI